MHKEILSEEQLRLLDLVSQFRREYFLVGGTAIALYLGHRRSIDFDLFKAGPIYHRRIISRISSAGYSFFVGRRVSDQLHVTVDGVKFTFVQYPFPINAPLKFENLMKMPELIDLAAMKAYALGRRSKWKDYVDMYFLLKESFSLEQISERAERIYGQLFSEKLFRAQLCYFNDIDYSESIEFISSPVPDSEIRKFLIEKAIDFEP